MFLLQKNKDTPGWTGLGHIEMAPIIGTNWPKLIQSYTWKGVNIVESCLSYIKSSQTERGMAIFMFDFNLNQVLISFIEPCPYYKLCDGTKNISFPCQ